MKKWQTHFLQTELFRENVSELQNMVYKPFLFQQTCYVQCFTKTATKATAEEDWSFSLFWITKGDKQV